MENGKRPTVVKDPEEATEVVAKVRAKADTRRPRDTRQPVTLKPGGAVMSVLTQLIAQSTGTALTGDGVKIAQSAFCEGQGLEGGWKLKLKGVELGETDGNQFIRITGAELVPVE